RSGPGLPAVFEGRSGPGLPALFEGRSGPGLPALFEGRSGPAAGRSGCATAYGRRSGLRHAKTPRRTVGAVGWRTMVGSAVPSVTGVDADAVGVWLREHDPTALPPFRFELIAGGHSNLTYRVSDANGQSYALRRPPLGHVLATAHDMGREHKIVSALGPTKVPVAPLVGLCTDDR